VLRAGDTGLAGRPTFDCRDDARVGDIGLVFGAGIPDVRRPLGARIPEVRRSGAGVGMAEVLRPVADSGRLNVALSGRLNGPS